MCVDACVMPLRGIVGLLCLTALVGCAEDLANPALIDGYRIMTLVAEPPEVGPDDTVQVVARDVDPEGRPVRYQWRVCLYSLGVLDNFRCVDESLYTELDEMGPQASIDFGPDGLNLRALYEQFGPIPTPDGGELTLETGFDVYVGLISTPEGGESERTWKRVTIREGGTPNANPFLDGFGIDDGPLRPLTPGEKVELRADLAEGASESYGDGLEEVVTYQWLSASGGLPETDTEPQTNRMDFTAPRTPGIYTIYVVVRDGRGGNALETLELTVQP